MLLAHGSSDARHAGEARALARRVSGLLGQEVGCAFLSDVCLPEGACVLPLFLGMGRHARVDAPALAAKSGACLLPPLAAHADEVARMACERVAAMGGEGRRKACALFGLYHFVGFEALYAALHARNARFRLMAQAALHAEPSIASVLGLWREESVAPVWFQPMLLFSGRSLETMTRQASGENVNIMTPLAEMDGFASFIAGLLASARTGR